MLAVVIASMLGFTSCEDEDNISRLGNWIECDADFPGTNRGGAVCFKIGNVAYVGTGANTNKTEEKERYRDFFSVTPNGTNKKYLDWSAKWDRTAEGVSSMPEEAALRNGGVAFSINGKGYVGLGYDGTNYLRDFWEFDPEGTPDPDQYPSMADSLKAKFSQTGKWTRIDNYPGDSCRYAVAFVIDNVAYVGTGEDWDNNILKDFYKFDGTKWSKMASIGRARAQATAFVMTDPKDGLEYGYVFGGVNSGSVDWFQRYNPREDVWEDLHRVADKTRQSFDDDYTLAGYGCTSFVYGGKGFITTGGAGIVSGYTWEYDAEGDYWVQKTNFEGYSRKFAVSFVLDVPTEDGGTTEVPYVSTGAGQDITVSGQGGSFYSDTWYFHPYEAYEYRD